MPTTVWSSRILKSSRFTEIRTYSKHYHEETKMNDVIYPLVVAAMNIINNNSALVCVEHLDIS
jgi:hypothetical protein